MLTVAAERQRLLPRERLRSRKRIAEVQREGRSLAQGPLRIRYLPGQTAGLCFTVVVGKRLGDAPRRNRIKRLLREAYRTGRMGPFAHAKGRGPSGSLDFLVFVREPQGLKLPALRAALWGLIGRALRDRRV